MNMMTALPRPSRPPSNDAARRSLRFRKLVSCFERDEIEAGVDALLAYLDAQAGDPDLETTVLENWEKPRGLLPEHRDAAIALAADDVEDDDPREGNGDELDGCRSEDCFGRHSADDTPGCPIADPGGCEHDGREPDYDAEVEQLVHDVPSIAIYANEPDVFTGKRDFLGWTLARYEGRPGKLTGEVDCGHVRFGASI